MKVNYYKWADLKINSSPSYSAGFTGLFATGPYLVPDFEWNLCEKRIQLIREFQKISIDIFRDALNSCKNLELLNWLINDTPVSFGLEYHKSLEGRHFTVPQFFRTDETSIGKIIEINCPGALWGEYQLTYDFCIKSGLNINVLSPAEQFVRQVKRLLNQVPVIHHMMDHATAPGSHRYFIEKTRPAAKYWGIDQNIKRQDCNFVRDGCFMSIIADDDFKPRLNKIGKGITYDLPPIVLFDQKATLALPFWSKTRKYFKEDIRNLFVYTTPLLPEGIELPDGSRMTIEEFSTLPRSERSYYLKYAGSDGSRSFGGKAVFRLSNMNKEDCLAKLQECISEYTNRGIWVLQEEKSHDDEVTYISRDGTIMTQKLRAKFNCFYGPFEFIGGLAMHRNHYKVSGKEDTVYSCMLPEGKS